jgi:hypothetical protein
MNFVRTPIKFLLKSTVSIYFYLTMNNRRGEACRGLALDRLQLGRLVGRCESRDPSDQGPVKASTFEHLN